jgi:hypothetical protein
MKVRKNRHRILTRLSHNKRSIWFITPFLVRAEKLRKTNEKIRAIVDAAFPEQKYEQPTF